MFASTRAVLIEPPVAFLDHSHYHYHCAGLIQFQLQVPVRAQHDDTRRWYIASVVFKFGFCDLLITCCSLVVFALLVHRLLLPLI